MYFQICTVVLRSPSRALQVNMVENVKFDHEFATFFGMFLLKYYTVQFGLDLLVNTQFSTGRNAEYNKKISWPVADVCSIVGLWTRSLIALSPVHWPKGVRYNIVMLVTSGPRTRSKSAVEEIFWKTKISGKILKLNPNSIEIWIKVKTELISSLELFRRRGDSDTGYAKRKLKVFEITFQIVRKVNYEKNFIWHSSP